MIRILLLYIIGLLLVGCGGSPVGPKVSDSEKTRERGTFEETVGRLDTPVLINAWIYRNRKGNPEAREGWTDPAGKSDVDNALSLAQAFFDKTGLICGNFAGFIVVCARTHGHECGAVSYDCHLVSWLKDFAGKIIVYSNGEKHLEFNARENLLQYYKEGYGEFEVWNNKLQIDAEWRKQEDGTWLTYPREK
jgi:hypothetical protein